jgi:hypothetical protein
MKLIWYKCETCGNSCLSEVRPDNSICGGCNNPNWKIMIHQTAYKVGHKDSINNNGEI